MKFKKKILNLIFPHLLKKEFCSSHILWNDRDQYYFFISWQQLIYNSFLGYYLYLNVEFDFLDNEKNASVKTAIFIILSVFIYHKV